MSNRYSDKFTELLFGIQESNVKGVEYQDILTQYFVQVDNFRNTVYQRIDVGAESEAAKGIPDYITSASLVTCYAKLVTSGKGFTDSQKVTSDINQVYVDFYNSFHCAYIDRVGTVKVLTTMDDMINLFTADVQKDDLWIFTPLLFDLKLLDNFHKWLRDKCVPYALNLDASWKDLLKVGVIDQFFKKNNRYAGLAHNFLVGAASTAWSTSKKKWIKDHFKFDDYTGVTLGSTEYTLFFNVGDLSENNKAIIKTFVDSNISIGHIHSILYPLLRISVDYNITKYNYQQYNVLSNIEDCDMDLLSRFYGHSDQSFIDLNTYFDLFLYLFRKI